MPREYTIKLPDNVVQNLDATYWRLLQTAESGTQPMTIEDLITQTVIEMWTTKLEEADFDKKIPR